jgi:hypothetical protein
MKADRIEYLDVPEADLLTARSFQEAVAAVPGGLRVRSIDPTSTEAAEKDFAASWHRLNDPDVLETPEARVDAAARFRAQGAELLTWRLRRVQAWEHRLLMEWAVAAARSRIVICSPAITDEATDHQLLRSLEDAAARGVRVTIAIPLQADKPLKGEADLRRRLADLTSRRKNMSLLERPGVKPLLLWDDSFVSGSFPWLAHEGDPERSLITSESVCVTDGDLTSTVLDQALSL